MKYINTLKTPKNRIIKMKIYTNLRVEFKMSGT